MGIFSFTELEKSVKLVANVSVAMKENEATLKNFIFALII